MDSKSSRRREKEKKSPSMIFSCSLCKYSTDKSANLSRHYKTMHETMKTLVQCCGLSFSNKADFRNHNKASHSNGHSCLVCHRNFSRRALLRRHLSVHTGFREFQCPFIKCNYGSSHKSNLTRHMRIHGINTSLKARVLEKRTNQLQTQRFQPDSTTKVSPSNNMKKLCLSHLSPIHDANNNNKNSNNNNISTSNKNNATTSTISNTSNATSCSIKSKEEFRRVLKSKLSSSNNADKIRKPKATATTTTTTTTTKKPIGYKASKLSHSIEAILSRDDGKETKESKSKTETNTISRPVLEDVKIIIMSMDIDEVTSTTSPLFSPNNNNSEGQEQQQQYHGGTSTSCFNDYFNLHNKNKNNIIQSQQQVEASKSFQSSRNMLYNNSNNNDNNYYYPSPQYHHLPLINHTTNPSAAICSSCDCLTPISMYNSSSLPISVLPSSSSPSLSSNVHPPEVCSNNSAFHSTFGDFNPSITQLRTNGQNSGQDPRILPIFHSPYVVPTSTSCYYHHQTFQPQVLVSDSFTPLTLAQPQPPPSTLTSKVAPYNSHQNHHHLSSPGPSSSDSYYGSSATLMSFARVSNYQPIEFVSY